MDSESMEFMEKWHLVIRHGYRSTMSNKTLFKLQKNYFTQDPQWVD